MSFNSNDNIMIHRGNYEEFFILYMDNELNAAEAAMVEAFVDANPDLKAELDLLVSTRLPQENLIFDKAPLLSENMKRTTTIDEELLLYIDGELSAPEKRVVELELESNRELRSHHELLLRAKLNPSDTIEFPDKQSLYRTSRRIGYFRPWIRVAAILVLVAGTGSLLVLNSPPPIQSTNQPTSRVTTPAVKENTDHETKLAENKAAEIPAETAGKKADEDADAARPSVKQNNVVAYTSQAKTNSGHDTELPSATDVTMSSRPVNVIVTARKIQDNDIAFTPPLEYKSINNSPVTNLLPERTTSNTDETPEMETASRERKGSFKGFLRKATRVIEKRTGIQATNDNGELLIGMVAVKLK